MSVKPYILYSVSVGLFFACSCKVHKNVAKNDSSPQAQQSKADTTPKQTPVPKITGTVSHRYKATGCNTIVITNHITPHGDTLILIPIKGIEGFDNDGEKISFNYRKLLIKNPPGCQHGITSLLYNVTKVE